VIPQGALVHVVPQIVERSMTPWRIDDVVADVGRIQMIEIPLGRVPVSALIDVDGDARRCVACPLPHTANPCVQEQG